MAYAGYSSSQQLVYYGRSDSFDNPWDREDCYYSNNAQAYPKVSAPCYYQAETTKPAKKEQDSFKYQQVQVNGNCRGNGMIPGSALLPTAFPKGTDPEIVKCFQMVDQDKSGFIDDKELQRALSSCNQSFSLRTIHLLMYLHTNNPNTRKIGPKEFMGVYHSLQNWRETFERFDTNRSGKIDSSELQRALKMLGFTVSPAILNLLIAKYDKTGFKKKGLEYDSFIECCLTVKGLTEKFKENDITCSGTATFTYEEFMSTVLPFVMF